jgi:hypothetical protein
MTKTLGRVEDHDGIGSFLGAERTVGRKKTIKVLNAKMGMLNPIERYFCNQQYHEGRITL